MALHHATDQIGFAAVIDQLRATAADGPIERPAFVQREEIGRRAHVAAFRLPVIDPFAGVFDHLAIRRNPLPGVYSLAVNSGSPDKNLKASESWLDPANFHRAQGHR